MGSVSSLYYIYIYIYIYIYSVCTCSVGSSSPGIFLTDVSLPGFFVLFGSRLSYCTLLHICFLVPPSFRPRGTCSWFSFFLIFFWYRRPCATRPIVSCLTALHQTRSLSCSLPLALSLCLSHSTRPRTQIVRESRACAQSLSLSPQVRARTPYTIYVCMYV